MVFVFRVYYHSDGCIPMKTSEIDYNSEHDTTPDWLKSQMEYVCDIAQSSLLFTFIVNDVIDDISQVASLK